MYMCIQQEGPINPLKITICGFEGLNNLFYSNNYPVQVKVSWHIYTL
jgi:hypothetical protein